MELYKPSSVKEVLNQNGLAAKKSLGQNFLVDWNILNKIGEAANLLAEDIILEVGPGLGTLGSVFSPWVSQWLAVEIDRDFKDHLSQLEIDFPNFHVFYGDFLKLSLSDFIGQRDYKLVANLPYYITSPIMEKVIESETRWTSMVLMVQWEVAQRLIAEPGTKEYGSLTVFIQYHGKVDIVTKVSRNSFYPTPDVDSAVIAINRHAKPPVAVEDKEFFFKVVKSAFHQRRKKVGNSVAKAPYLGFSIEEVRAALERAKISQERRGETLSLPDFARLAEALYQLL